MLTWWTEEWSFGDGPSRTRCRISRTSGGYAVEVVQGSTCIDSYVYRTRAEAVAAAQILKLNYRPKRKLSYRSPVEQHE